VAIGIIHNNAVNAYYSYCLFMVIGIGGGSKFAQGVLQW